MTLTINGIVHAVNVDGSFIDTLSISEGLNTITITAVDAAGNTSSIVRTIRLDTQPPVIVLNSPLRQSHNQSFRNNCRQQGNGLNNCCTERKWRYCFYFE